ncbi:MAG: 1-acyl-sn-glycerol-3-phosphate acyltransferase [Deltaproteobacteria bacterium]|nr:1-acyl-sn-glycerol-3-phosphate acyltransferase [Deltaproteobacteria bacterium]
MRVDASSKAACPPGEARRNVLRLLYLPWTWLVFIPSLALCTLFFGTIAILLSYVWPRASVAMGYFYGWVLCRLNFVFVSVRGWSNLVPGVSYVMVSNHQSHFDVLILMGHIWRDFKWVIKEELRHIPVFGRACQRIGHIHINRKDRQKAIEALNAARPRLVGGTCVLFFPEGTRSPDGRMREFKKGAFVMALDLGLPILPISVSGTNAILPGRSFKLLPGLARVTIHPAVDPGAYGAEGKDRLMADVRAIIASGLTEWERGWVPERESSAPCPSERPPAAERTVHPPSGLSGDPV